MADQAFEAQLQRLFAQAPALPDAALFAARVEGRLDRGWAMRRLLIGAAGALGGALAVVRLVGSNVVQRIAVQSDTSFAHLQSSMGQLGAHWRGQSFNVAGLQLGGTEALWLVAGLAAMAAALFATRVIDEI